MKPPLRSALFLLLSLADADCLAQAQDLDVIQFSSTHYSAVENSGTVGILIQRNGPMTDYATFTVRTLAQTAGTNDFRTLSEMVWMEPGQSNLTVMLELLNDAVTEGPEWFDVIISDPDPFCCQLGAITRAQVWIVDNDVGVHFAADTHHIDENAGELRISVFRFGDITNAGSIMVQIDGGSAQSGVDFVLSTNRVSFLEGQTNATITIEIPNDAIADGSKHFNLRFESNPDPACCSLGPRAWTQVWIHENDWGVTFSGSGAQVGEGDGQHVLELWRGGDLIATECAVTIRAIDGTWTNGMDYSLGATTFSFAPGQSNLYVPVFILNDIAREEPEIFRLQLTGDPAGCAYGAVYIYILDNDSGVEFSQWPYSLAENDPAVILHLQRFGDATNEFTVDLLLDGTATAGVDFVLPTNRLYFAAGQTNLTLLVPLLDDPFVEGEEHFGLYLTNVTGDVPLGRQVACRVNLQDTEYAVDMVDRAFNSEWLGTITAALRQPDGKLLVGAQDQYGSPRLKRLNADRSLDTNFTQLRFDGYIIAALALQADGKIICAGDFHRYAAGAYRHDIARVLADGRADPEFNALLGGSTYIRCVEVLPDGRILVGGSIVVDASGVAIGIVRLTHAGGYDPSFNVALDRPEVSAIVRQPDGLIVFGGLFATVNSYVRPGLARVFGDGLLDRGFEPPLLDSNAWVSTLALLADGNLLVVLSSNRVIRLNGTDGSIDPSFEADLGTNSSIANITVQPDGKLLLQGDIFGADNNRVGAIVRLHADGSLDDSFASATGSGFVEWLDGRIFTAHDSRVVRLLPETPAFSFWLASSSYAVPEHGTNISLTILRGGNSASLLSVDFIAAGEAVSGLDFTPSGGRITFEPLVNSNQIVLEIMNDCVIETNEMLEVVLTNPPAATALSPPNRATLRIVDDEAAGMLDRFNPSLHWLRTPDSYSYPDTVAMALQPDGKVVIGWRGVITRLNGDGSRDPSFQHGAAICGGSALYYFYPSCGIHSIVLQPDGKILAGGHGAAIRLHPDGAVDTIFFFHATYFSCWGGGHGHGEVCGSFPADVRSLLLQPDGKVLAIGNFDAGYGFVRLNPDSTFDTNFNGSYGLGSANQAALLADGKLLVLAPGHSVLPIRLNPDGSRDTNFQTFSASGSVSAVAVLEDQRILIAGSINLTNNAPPRALARLHADGSLDTNFNPVIVRGSFSMTYAHALTVAKDGSIFLAGDFADGISRVVKLDAEGGQIRTFSSDLEFGYGASINSMIEQPEDGKLLVSGSFYDASGVRRPGIARLVSERSHIHLSPPALLPDGSMRVVTGSHVGATYVLQRSADLKEWTRVATNIAADCTVEFTDAAPSQGAGFYRVILETEKW